jgi:hypothetical protein
VTARRSRVACSRPVLAHFATREFRLNDARPDAFEVELRLRSIPHDGVRIHRRPRTPPASVVAPRVTTTSSRDLRLGDDDGGAHARRERHDLRVGRHRCATAGRRAGIGGRVDGARARSRSAGKCPKFGVIEVVHALRDRARFARLGCTPSARAESSDGLSERVEGRRDDIESTSRVASEGR